MAPTLGRVMVFSRRLALLTVAGAVLALGGLTAAGARDSGAHGLAKSCRKGSVPGVITGKQSCLKSGQRCVPRYDTQYHRFGFHCHASSRLTRRLIPKPVDTPPRLNVLKRSSPLTPGFVFFAPKNGTGASGPEIADDHGRLVWFDPLKADSATDFRVQRYQGRPVLTWWQGGGIGAEGTDYIADASYHVIATVHAGNGLGADAHEFVLTPQGTALITVYHEVPYDLSSLGGPANGTVLDSVVQEIDIATGQVVFEWHSLDHVAPSESYEPIDTSYDYFHINAVNLDNDGNLLISGRHTWTVYKVDRHTGAILWRLGGKKSDFTLGPGVHFAWQHNPLPAGDNTIRLFDNESNGTNSVSPPTRVIWIHLDPAALTATLVKAISHPASILVTSQGNAQALDNGNTFVGWGDRGRVSEFDPQGNLLFDAVLTKTADTYRAYRSLWSGQPDTQPTATARTNKNGTTTVHAIWNGATQVASWRVMAGSAANKLASVRKAPWNGLDTAITIKGIPSEVKVVALDPNGAVIGTSKPVVVG
jgi:hypothetical protein